MIYADHNGTSPPLQVVRDHLIKRMTTNIFANPNATHSLGQNLLKTIEQCREGIADIFSCHPSQIIFNSGSSEGINHILYSILTQAKNKKILVSPIEHSAVYEALSFFETKHNFEIIWMPISKTGAIDPLVVQDMIEKQRDKLALVCLMAANNETGVIQPYKEVNRICEKHDIPFFSDTTQYIGKQPFNFERSGLNYAVLAGHKCGAIPGIGAIIVEEPTELLPFIFGGHQESGHRAGTQNYLGIETLFLALKDLNEKKNNFEILTHKRKEFEIKIKNMFPEVVIIGEESPRLAGTTLLSYPGILGQAVQIELESQDVFVTTSSACSDNDPQTSRVLKVMGFDDIVGRSVIRISFSISQNINQYDELLFKLSHAYQKLSRIKT